MKTPKKLLRTLVLGAALTLAIAGCTTEEGDTGPASDGPKNGESYVFGNIAYNMKDVWNKYSADSFEFATTQVDEPIDVVLLDAENSLEKSVALMEELIAKDVDGISIFPISPEQGATRTPSPRSRRTSTSP